MLEDSRPILKRAQSFLTEMFNTFEVNMLLNPAAPHKPRAALLVKTHHEVSPHDLAAMEPDLRAQGVAIRNTDLTAIPMYAAERPDPTMAHIGISRASKVELHLMADGRILICAKSKTGQRQLSIKQDEELAETCAQLFRLPQVVAPPDKLPIIARAYPADATNSTRYVEMPSWISQRLGQVLQDGFRFHVLLTAACTVGSRAVIIEKVVLSIPSDLAKSCQLAVRIHKSAATCICAAHQKPTMEVSHVQVNFQFCGMVPSSTHNRMCIRHVECPPNLADALPVCCLHNFTAKVTCGNYTHPMPIPEDSVERLRILATASVALVDKNAEDVVPVKEMVDAVFSVGEACETPDSTKNIDLDVIAVECFAPVASHHSRRRAFFGMQPPAFRCRARPSHDSCTSVQEASLNVTTRLATGTHR